MKCTNKKISKRRLRRKRRQRVLCTAFVFLLFIVGSFIVFGKDEQASIKDYEQMYASEIYRESLQTERLCIAVDDVPYEAFDATDQLHAAALFQLDEKNVLYAENIHDRIYPASTTKILTAYVALKYGNLNDIVEVSRMATSVPADSSNAGLQLGDQMTLKDALYGLMLPSGNDSAVAIAEHISGSLDEFMVLMNREAQALGATQTHFTTPHGYQDANHYTTAYDLYLIFNECIQNPDFLEIVSTAEYTTDIKQADGTLRNTTWKQSNQFVNGLQEVPEGLQVYGGKTGTTSEAGACLILYFEDREANPYIAIMMGASNRPVLYENMTNLIETVAKS